MANLFDVYKVFRPRRTILSDDFNSLQNVLKASFDKIGTAPPGAETGVSSTFYCADPTAAQHAVTKTYFESNFDTFAAPEIAVAQEWAEKAYTVEISTTPGSYSALHHATAAAGYAYTASLYSASASAIRFEDANYLTFFYGTS